MKNFYKFFIFRTISLVPTVFGVIILVFILSHVIPGSPALRLLGDQYNAQELQTIQAELGLNHPLYIQFEQYLWQLIHFNLGYSIMVGYSVNYEIGQRAPASFDLAIFAMLIGVPIALFTGVNAALRVNRAGDHASRVASLLGVSMPVFWIDIILILVFYVYLHIAPYPVGQISFALAPTVHQLTGSVILDSLLTLNLSALGSSLWHIMLPAIGLSFAVIATISRVVRSSMLDVLNKDYMRTAFAIGLPRNVLINKYALKNALLPAITVAAIQAGALMGGVVLTESMFSWPGLGSYAVTAIESQDYPSVMGVVLVAALLFVVINFIADIVYAYIDPRVKY